MTSPDLSDLTVFVDGSDQHLDYYTVFSGLTRGRCAEVAVSRSNPERFHVRPFLIPSYMQGITDASFVRRSALSSRRKPPLPENFRKRNDAFLYFVVF